MEGNLAALARHAMDDRADVLDVDRGLFAAFEDRRVTDDQGAVVHDGRPLDHIGDDVSAPDSVNRSLRRQSLPIERAGSFRVVDGLSQVRMDAPTSRRAGRCGCATAC
jgi:alkyl sulfatase BDS1-like metallo-beta-lactamase superfamily hydrolase